MAAVFELDAELLEECLSSRARHVVTMFLHYALSLVRQQATDAFEDFAVSLSLAATPLPKRLARFGAHDDADESLACDVVARLRRQEESARGGEDSAGAWKEKSPDDVGVVEVGPRASRVEACRSPCCCTCGVDVGAFGARVVSNLDACLSYSARRNAADAKALAAIKAAFLEGLATLREQLEELNGPQKKVKTLEAQTNRFLRHEIKNALVGSLADLDALRCTITRAINPPAAPRKQAKRVSPTITQRAPEKTSAAPPHRHQQQPLFVAAAAAEGSSASSFSEEDDDDDDDEDEEPVAQQLDDDDDEEESTRPSALTEEVRASVVEALDTVARDLTHTMDIILSASTVSAIVAGTYTVRRSPQDLGSICASMFVPGGLSVEPGAFVVDTDGALVRHILTNAVSNATKYSAPNSPVKVVLRWTDAPPFDHQPQKDDGTLRYVVADVWNVAGKDHDKLRSLKNPREIFEQGTRFHFFDGPPTWISSTKSTCLVSAGDGAWIMQRCALTLGGSCAIDFLPNQTKFTVYFPASCPGATTNQGEDLESRRVDESPLGVTTSDTAPDRTDVVVQEQLAQPPPTATVAASSPSASKTRKTIPPRHWPGTRRGGVADDHHLLRKKNALTTTTTKPVRWSTSGSSLCPLVPIATEPPREEGSAPIIPMVLLSPRSMSPRAECRHVQPEEPFTLPPNTTLVALDDAPSQRRLLARFSHDLGAAASYIFGDVADVADTFVDRARQLVKEAAGRIVFFLDDHLLFKRPDGSTVTRSGITLGQQLRANLYEDDTESKVLLLVRTAEDDKEKVKSCHVILHGHFPKCPMNTSTFRNELGVHWNARFPKR